MVIILPRHKTAAENIGAGLRKGLEKGFEEQMNEASEKRDFARKNKLRQMQNLESKEAAFQKQNQLKNALQDIESIYNNPDLSDQQKTIATYRQLAANPDLAKQLSSQLGSLSQSQKEEDFFSKLMSGGGQPGAEETSAEVTPEGEQAERGQKSRQFNYNDPETWSNKQIDTFRAIESKSPKSKTLKNLAQNEYDRRLEGKKAKTKYLENLAPFETALETLDRMEEIGKGGNLGVGSKYHGLISPKTRRDRSEYERLGKSLISYASNIPIRNRQEFEVLAHDLYDPSISDDSREGILTAMRRIIENSMRQYEAPEQRPGRSTEIGEVKVPTQAGALGPSKERPPLTSFMR